MVLRGLKTIKWYQSQVAFLIIKLILDPCCFGFLENLDAFLSTCLFCVFVSCCFYKSFLELLGLITCDNNYLCCTALTTLKAHDSCLWYLVLGLVPLNPIVWCYVWYYVWHYVWHDVWLNIVINKLVLLLSEIIVTWIFRHYHIVHEMHSMWFMWKVIEDINYKFFVNLEFSS